MPTQTDTAPVDVIRCPVHGIPDCSPLLNGCSIPNRLAAAYERGRGDMAAAVDAVLDGLDSIHDAVMVRAVMVGSERA